MSDCCAPQAPEDCHPRKRRCPGCGRECSELSVRTILHHVRDAWKWRPTAERHFFCDGPECEIAYFGDDGSSIPASRLRPRIQAAGISDDSLLCHCFGVTRSDFRAMPAALEFVISQTKAGVCSCETSNPSGRCCLKDFPRSES